MVISDVNYGLSLGIVKRHREILEYSWMGVGPFDVLILGRIFGYKVGKLP